MISTKKVLSVAITLPFPSKNIPLQYPVNDFQDMYGPTQSHEST